MEQKEKNMMIGKKILAWLGVFFLIVPVIAVIGLIFYIPDALFDLNNTSDLWKVFVGNDVSQVFIGIFALVGAYLLRDNIQYLFKAKEMRRLLPLIITSFFFCACRNTQTTPASQTTSDSTSIMSLIDNAVYEHIGCNYSQAFGKRWHVFTWASDNVFVASPGPVVSTFFDSIYQLVTSEFGEYRYSKQDFDSNIKLFNADTAMFDLYRMEALKSLYYWCNDSLVIGCAQDSENFMLVSINRLYLPEPSAPLIELVQNTEFSTKRPYTIWAGQKWEVHSLPGDTIFAAISPSLGANVLDSLHGLMCREYGDPKDSYRHTPSGRTVNTNQLRELINKPEISQFYIWGQKQENDSVSVCLAHYNARPEQGELFVADGYLYIAFASQEIADRWYRKNQ